MLIAIEGIDGAGKATITERLSTEFFGTYDGGVYDYGDTHVYGFPDYSSPSGELIRDYLNGRLRLNPMQAAKLYAINQHETWQFIEHDLADDKMVILDRFVSSNIAFQSARLDNPLDKIALQNRINYISHTQYMMDKPDITIYLRVSPQEAQRRMETREQLDIHETDIEYQAKVATIYDELSKSTSWITINCEGKSPDEIMKELTIQLTERLNSLTTSSII